MLEKMHLRKTGLYDETWPDLLISFLLFLFLAMDSDDDEEFMEIVQQLLLAAFPGVRYAPGSAAAAAAAPAAALAVWGNPTPAAGDAVAASVTAAYNSAAAYTAAAAGLSSLELMEHEESRLSRGD